ncbi:hypothetical protein ACNOYE_25715 [Nannocystaceae bacterium ST9]
MTTRKPVLLRLDRLTLHLPPGFESRASGLARLIGEHMLTQAWPNELRRADLRLEHLSINPGASDRAIAERVAVALHARLRAEGGKP